MENKERNLRDDFAETAMEQIMSAVPFGSVVSSKRIAKSAYCLADAMMKRRLKGRK